MKLRAKKVSDKIDLNMTPMIDVTFQLLTFFLMTFKIAAQEGDFNIKMPLAAAGGAPQDIPPVKLQLSANADGSMNLMRMGGRPLGSGASAFQLLHQEIRGIVGGDSGPGSLASQMEVEIDADPRLHYINVVNAISAVSGYVDPATGTVFKLIEKVKFTPPKGP